MRFLFSIFSRCNIYTIMLSSKRDKCMNIILLDIVASGFHQNEWMVFQTTILHYKALLGWKQPGLMGWILLYFMLLVQDWLLDLLISSPVRYFYATAAPFLSPDSALSPWQPQHKIAVLMYLITKLALKTYELCIILWSNIYMFINPPT